MSSTQLAQCINSVSRATPKQFPNLRKAEISGEVVRSIFCFSGEVVCSIFCFITWRSNAVLASSNHPLKKQENTGKWEWVCTQRWQDRPLQGLEHKAQAPRSGCLQYHCPVLLHEAMPRWDPQSESPPLRAKWQQNKTYHKTEKQPGACLFFLSFW